jgi:hypothetical protein
VSSHERKKFLTKVPSVVRMSSLCFIQLNELFRSIDLMWSDPDDVENWAVSPRGAGWLFGDRVTREFNHFNSLKLIARAHQLVQEGYKFMFENQLVTVWSAPNYCYRCGNLASVLKIWEDGSQDFKVYEAAIENERDKGMLRTKKTVSILVFDSFDRLTTATREICHTLFDPSFVVDRTHMLCSHSYLSGVLDVAWISWLFHPLLLYSVHMMMMYYLT